MSVVHHPAQSGPAYQHIPDSCSSPSASDVPPSGGQKPFFHPLTQHQYETADEIPLHSLTSPPKPAEMHQQRHWPSKISGRWRPSERLQRWSDAWSKVSKHPYCRWAGRTWFLRVFRSVVILSQLALVLECFVDWEYTIERSGKLEIITSSIAVAWDAFALIADLSRQESPLILPVIPAAVDVAVSLLITIIMIRGLWIVSLWPNEEITIGKPSLYVATSILLILLLSLSGMINYRSWKSMRVQMQYYRAYRVLEPVIVFTADGKPVAAFPHEYGNNGLAP